jgi:DNA-binding transcriptional MerR regulator
MLTIGQLAAFAGVTVRAVRHYETRGLLPEPVRDVSGYRRYDGQAVIDLVKIKTLAEAGVPLSRVADLLAASPEEFAATLAALDADLEQRIEQLVERRRRVTGLLAGDRLILPASVTDFLDFLRSFGVGEATVTAERDGWMLLHVVAPEQVDTLVGHKRDALADPDFRRLYLAFDQAAGWSPNDPRLPGLADDMVAFTRRHLARARGAEQEPSAFDDLLASRQSREFEALMNSLPNTQTPAWTRLDELCWARLNGVSN